jgi:hypothetical protein
VLAVATAGTTACSTALRLLPRGRVGRRSARLGAVACVALGVHVALGMHIARVPARIARALLAAPGYAFWKAALWVRVVARPDAVQWSRTQRNDEAVVA